MSPREVKDVIHPVGHLGHGGAFRYIPGKIFHVLDGIFDRFGVESPDAEAEAQEPWDEALRQVSSCADYQGLDLSHLPTFYL